MLEKKVSTCAHIAAAGSGNMQQTRSSKLLPVWCIAACGAVAFGAAKKAHPAAAMRRTSSNHCGVWQLCVAAIQETHDRQQQRMGMDK